MEKPLNARRSEDGLWLWSHSHTTRLLQLPFRVIVQLGSAIACSGFLKFNSLNVVSYVNSNT